MSIMDTTDFIADYKYLRFFCIYDNEQYRNRYKVNNNSF